MNNNDSGYLYAIVAVGLISLMIGMGYIMGEQVSRRGHIETGKEIGRTEAIIFCNEKPKDCKYEFDYMKYKESRVNQK